MKILESCGVVAAVCVGFLTTAQAVEVTFLSDDDGAYQAQNSSTRSIDCQAPATCDIEPGRYRLINFNFEHSVYITVESDGTVIYTYEGGLLFPFASAATPTSPTTPTTPTPPTTPTGNTQFSIESVIATNECFVPQPGRPGELGNPLCVARCPDGYTVTGGNCRGITDSVRIFFPDNSGARFENIRQPLIETPVQGGYQCAFDDGYQYTGSLYDFNNSDGTIITATAICSTIVSQ